MAPSVQLQVEKQKQVQKGYEASALHIQNFKSGKLALKPGCDAAQTLEDNITGELNKIREAAGKVGLEGRCLLEAHSLFCGFG